MSNLIFERIPKIMSEIGAIGKGHKNPQQGYSFRGIDDVYNAVNASLAKHGVFCVPVILDMTREERQTQKGGTLLYTILKIKYTFYASDGSSFECVTIGEAMDSGDKSCNKAMSAAQKYAFFQVFSIPTEEPKDTENETHEVKPKDAETARPEATARHGQPAASDSEPAHRTPGKPITDGQRKLIYAKAKAAGITEDEVKKAFNVKHLSDLTMGQVNEVLAWIENPHDFGPQPADDTPF